MNADVDLPRLPSQTIDQHLRFDDSDAGNCELPLDKRVVESLFAESEPADKEIAAIVEMVTRSGGLDYARRKALDFAGEANAALDGLPDGPALQALRQSIVYAVERRR